jgi:hypothetical protein
MLRDEGGDAFQRFLAPFCCSDSRREEMQSALSHGHKPADVVRSPHYRKDLVDDDNQGPRVPQKCGCGIIFAADMEGKLIVDGFVHGGSAEASRTIQKGLTFDLMNIDTKLNVRLQEMYYDLSMGTVNTNCCHCIFSLVTLG